MKVSIICPDLGKNVAGRSYVLASMLQRYCDVEILGVSSSGSIWQPMKDAPFKISNYGRVKLSQLNSIAEIIADNFSSDFIIVQEARLESLVIGNKIRKLKNLPALLDVGDFHLSKFISLNMFELFLQDSFKTNTILLTRYFYKRLFNPRLFLQDSLDPGNLFSLLYADYLSKDYNNITVTNDSLKKIYGGTILPDGQNHEFINPKNYMNTNLRARLGLVEDDEVILFLGTPQPHKGLIEVALAIKGTKRPNLKYLVVGSNANNKIIKEIKSILGSQLVTIGPIPFSEIGEYYAISDLAIFLQKKEGYGIAQLPAKIFDAMAMGKPMIISNIPNSREYLPHALRLDNAKDYKELAKLINKIFIDKNLAIKIGHAGRQTFLENYTWDILGDKLYKIITKVVN